MANDLLNHAYVMKPPLKTQKDGVQRASGLMNIWRLCEIAVPGNGMDMEAPYLPPTLSPMHLFHLVVPDLYLFVIT